VAAAWVEQGGRVAECNEAWRSRVGGEGGPLAELIHSGERATVAAVLGEATEEGARPTVTCRVKTPEGEWRGYRLQVRADGGIGGLGLGAGWLICLQEEGADDDTPIRFVQRVVEELSRELDASRLLARAAAQLVEGLGVVTAFIPVLDRDGEGAVVAAAAGAGAESLEGSRVEGGAGVAGRIALGGEAGVFFADPQVADPLFPDGAPAEIVFAPIAYRERVLGGVCAVPAGDAGAGLVECVRLLARFLSGGLQGARHFDRLRLARDHHQRLLAVLPDPLWLVGSDGRVAECNTPARDLLQDDGVGKSVATLFAGETGERIAAAVAAVGADGRHDLRLGLGDQAVPCLVTVLPFAGTASEGGALVVARDISEWIASEREREQMRAATEESARLASVGELATGMAHEINNPLMGIINYADLARDELPDDSPVVEWMGVIIEEGERIAALLRHLRSLGRRDPRPPAATLLVSAVESACALVRHSLGREQIDLVVDIPEGLPPVRAVSHQLQQVLVALFSNARWAVAEARRRGVEGRGWIRLSARQVAIEGGGGEVRVVVEDSGVGIAEADLARVFDPFFTRRSGRSGLGLGLSQARRDVGAWGGRIYAESGDVGGARVCLVIPCWEENS